MLARVSASRLLLLPIAVFLSGLVHWGFVANFHTSTNPITNIFYVVSGDCGVLVGLYMYLNFLNPNEVPMHFVCICLGAGLAGFGLYSFVPKDSQILGFTSLITGALLVIAGGLLNQRVRLALTMVIAGGLLILYAIYLSWI